MPKKKKVSKIAKMALVPAVDIIGLGITSDVIQTSGVTGQARHIVDKIPTIHGAAILKKTAKNKYF